MRTVNAYAATAATRPLGPTTIQRRDLGPHDVLIEIKFCGICHSDIHHARSEWGAATYPVVPGHEIAGVVAQVGSKVTRHAVGDRVGVGCLVDSCGDCANCRKGEEQLCLKGSTLTYGSIRQTQEMLNFCARHRIGADIEVIPASKINEAYERVLASDVRYRFVIDAATLK
ncbi:alcohol dehydrogenase [Cystobacter fuscus]|uniref:Alcohol dehydrogenase n=1 Tax=Cystobacter fuscus TaxID=43 RepID=A0A250J7A2_9BACT|nr:alcohol dehydrogenase catalytic domain-containing protein [Cystobacter fuscus]ATB39805.1 alcohol dehydrogenase [Cystobacter fuscus]